MNFAMPAAAAAMPPKPSSAAISATTKNPMAQRSMAASLQNQNNKNHSGFWSPYDFAISSNRKGTRGSIPHTLYVSDNWVVLAQK